MLVQRTENINQLDNPYIHRQCVEKCDTVPGYKTFLNRCVPENKGEPMISQSFLSKTGLVNFFQEVSEDLSLCWSKVSYVCLISFVFSFIVLILFRYVVGFVVWIVLISSVITSIFATIFLWIKYAQNKNNPNSERVTTYLVLAIVATCAAIIIALIIFVMRKRVKLVIQLFKEAGKAISDMPMLLFEPFLVSNTHE